MKQSYIFLQDTFVPEEQATIPVTTHALHYGSGCFEGIRAYYNKNHNALYIFRMEDHYKRLFESAKLLFISLPYDIKKLCEITRELVQKNFDNTDLYIRPLAYKTDPAIGNFTLTKIADGFLIYTKMHGRHAESTNGIRANISSWTRTSENSIPPKAKITGGYVNTLLAKTESVLAGYDETLFVDTNGHLLEGSVENLFMVKDGCVITPPKSDGILCGITRDTVITLCKDVLRLPINERSITRAEAYQADEIFLTGTGAEIMPVTEIEGRKIGTGMVSPITKQIKDVYEKIVHGEDERYTHWLTKVTITSNT